ncbi:MAPEG family protein [Pararhizobium sp. BT-229]|uniref:MAPEG family protein n=1 Tax=Pararhizobium sp. BT-229 TaxID=2986923 RepID=UPI0021F6A924|nr:MAPEG family protein [Pararhizobium sp. BT-229]MCV9962946.1 MAPEG family protein [Pararhizobium sp. BT-229]
MPTSTAIFWPVIVQVALIHAVYFLMLKRRYRAVRTGLAKPQDYWVPAIEPAPSATAARSLINQFELPVLFFLVCILLYMTAGVNDVVLATAWLFVLSRFAHAYVHVTSNRLRIRQRLFVVGFVLNSILWLLFAVHIAGI